jgi:hypothetical protein
MQKSILKYAILALISSLFVACNWFNDGKESEPSSNPDFRSLTFTKNDSVPGLQNAKFTLEFDAALGDSVIVNLDSLPYLSNISRVIATFGWASTSRASVYYHYLDSLSQSVIDTINLVGKGKDTIDFTRATRVQNIATDGKATRTYYLKVNVHQIQPELYVWSRIKEQVITEPTTYQQVIFFNNKFFYYANHIYPPYDSWMYLYTSTDGISWKEESTTGLLFLGALHDHHGYVIESKSPGKIIEFNNKLYVERFGKIYSSANGYDWAEQTINNSGLNFATLLFALSNKLWAVTGDYHFASSSDGSTWTIGSAIPDNFPVSNFASLSFASATKQPKALIVGGVSKNYETLKNVWSTENGNYWVDFSRENNNRIIPHTNASLVKYNDRIFLFGGKAIADTIQTPMLESLNDGLSWSIPDSTNNVLWQITSRNIGDSIAYDTLKYIPRQAPSAIYITPAEGSNEHYIYLIGGSPYSDVWRGKLNKLSFERK